MFIARGLVYLNVNKTTNAICGQYSKPDYPDESGYSPNTTRIYSGFFIRMKPDLGRIIRFIVLTDNPLIRSNKFVG